MQIFPAPQGTFVIARQPGDQSILTPVVGFQYVQTGPVYPLTVMSFGGLTKGVALLHDSGHVSDPSIGMTFATRQEWERAVDTDGYWSAKDMTPKPPKLIEQAAEAIRAAAEDDQLPHHEVSSVVKAMPATSLRIPDKPKGKPQIFLNKTFWRSSDRFGSGYVFMIEGGEEAPAKNDPNYVKIKREEMLDLKRKGVPAGQYGVTPAPATPKKPDPLEDLI